MESLKLNEKTPAPEESFWLRQFQDEATDDQKKFDWIFGVALPVLCFFFDPLVFKGDLWGTPYLGSFRPFAYLLSFACILSMITWLLYGDRLKWLNAFCAGLFAVGGIVSLSIGVVLLPISLLGLILLIGALGFTPFFSALVYLRNAWRASRSARLFLEKKVLVNSLVLSAIVSLVVPLIANLQIERILEEMKNGDAATIRANAEKLRYVAPLVEFDLLALHYHRSNAIVRNSEQMRVLAEVYQDLTGVDIEEKTGVLLD